MKKKKLNQKPKDLPTQEPEKTRTNPNYTLKENFKIYIYKKNKSINESRNCSWRRVESETLWEIFELNNGRESLYQFLFVGYFERGARVLASAQGSRSSNWKQRKSPLYINPFSFRPTNFCTREILFFCLFKLHPFFLILGQYFFFFPIWVLILNFYNLLHIKLWKCCQELCILTNTRKCFQHKQFEFKSPAHIVYIKL